MQAIRSTVSTNTKFCCSKQKIPNYRGQTVQRKKKKKKAPKIEQKEYLTKLIQQTYGGNNYRAPRAEA